MKELITPENKDWFYERYAINSLLREDEEASQEEQEYDSEYHMLCEFLLRKRLGVLAYQNEKEAFENIKRGFKHYNEEMEELADHYADYIYDLMELQEKRTGEKPTLYTQYATKCYSAPGSCLAIDAVVVTSNEMVVVFNDATLKEKVVAKDGEIYSEYGIPALCALREFNVRNRHISLIRFVIYQKRITSRTEAVLSKDELLNYETTRINPSIDYIVSRIKETKGEE